MGRKGVFTTKAQRSQREYQEIEPQRTRRSLRHSEKRRVHHKGTKTTKGIPRDRTAENAEIAETFREKAGSPQGTKSTKGIPRDRTAENAEIAETFRDLE
jgi:hypothetical protein